MGTRKHRKIRLSELAQADWEQLDPTPVALPLGSPEPTLRDLVRQYIRQEISAQAASQGAGTFEEEDDFEVDDEPDLTTRYTVHDVVDEVPESISGPGEAAEPERSESPPVPEPQPPASGGKEA